MRNLPALPFFLGFPHTFRHVKALLSLTVLSLLISACGGSDSGSEAGVVRGAPDLRLVDLSINGQAVPDFNPDIPAPSGLGKTRPGAYELVVAADVESLSIVPTVADDRVGKVRISISQRAYVVDDRGRLAFTNSLSFDDVDSGATYTPVETVRDESGNAVERENTLERGDNYYQIRVATLDRSLFIDYYVNIRRASDSADLGNIFINPVTTTENGQQIFRALDPAFDPEVTSYRLVEVDSAGNRASEASPLPYELCAFQLALVSGDPFLKMSFNGRSIETGRPFDVPLQVGENNVLISTEAEEGGATREYTIAVVRREPTQAQLDDDGTLVSLEVDASTRVDNFSCLQRSGNSVRLNANRSTFSVTAVPGAAETTMTFGKLATEVVDGNSLSYVEDPQVLTAGEALEVNFDPASNQQTYVINTVSKSALAGREGNERDLVTNTAYLLDVQKSSTNWIEVSNAAELQSALKNAQPNDEIIIAAGDYLGEASEMASGDAEAHFYSAQSGTAEQPIRLRSEINVGGERALLQGGDSSQNAVFKLAGDHWVISNLLFESAKVGLIFNGASNNWASVLIRDVGQQGVRFENGSNGNILSGASLTRIAQGELSDLDREMAAAVVVGSDDITWNELPGMGELSPANNNNMLIGNFIGPSVGAPLVRVNEGSVGSQLHYNLFNSSDYSASGRSAADDSAIVIRGNGTEIIGNSVLHQNTSAPSQIIAMGEASEEGHATDWGENTHIYQNFFTLAEDTLTAVNSYGAIDATVSENTLVGSESMPLYSGSGLVQSQEKLTYRIRMTSNPDLCFMEDEQEVLVGSDDSPVSSLQRIVVLANCGESDKFKWHFVNQGSGYVHIYSASQPNLLIRPEVTRITGDVITRPELGTDFFYLFLSEVPPRFQGGFSYLWRVQNVTNELIIVNRQKPNFGMFVPQQDFMENGRVRFMPQATRAGRELTLERIAP